MYSNVKLGSLNWSLNWSLSPVWWVLHPPDWPLSFRILFSPLFSSALWITLVDSVPFLPFLFLHPSLRPALYFCMLPIVRQWLRHDSGTAEIKRHFFCDRLKVLLTSHVQRVQINLLFIKENKKHASYTSRVYLGNITQVGQMKGKRFKGIAYQCKYANPHPS